MVYEWDPPIEGTASANKENAKRDLKNTLEKLFMLHTKEEDAKRKFMSDIESR